MSVSKRPSQGDSVKGNLTNVGPRSSPLEFERKADRGAPLLGCIDFPHGGWAQGRFLRLQPEHADPEMGIGSDPCPADALVRGVAEFRGWLRQVEAAGR